MLRSDRCTVVFHSVTSHRSGGLCDASPVARSFLHKTASLSLLLLLASRSDRRVCIVQEGKFRPGRGRLAICSSAIDSSVRTWPLLFRARRRFDEIYLSFSVEILSYDVIIDLCLSSRCAARECAAGRGEFSFLFSRGRSVENEETPLKFRFDSDFSRPRRRGWRGRVQYVGHRRLNWLTQTRIYKRLACRLTCPGPPGVGSILSLTSLTRQ